MANSNLPPTNEEKLSQLMDGEWDGLNPSDCIAGICDDEQLRDKWSRYHLIRDCMNTEPVQVNPSLLANISAAIAEEPSYSNITPFAAAGDAPSIVVRKEHADQTTENSEGVVTGNAETVTPFEKKADSPKSKTRPSSTFWGTGFKGLAVAASVAAVTVVGMNVWQGQSGGSANPAGSSLAANTLLPSSPVNAFSQQIEGAPLPEVDLVSNAGSYWVSPQTSERVSDEQKLNMFLSQHLENSPTASREGLLPYSRLVGYDNQAAEQ